MTRGGEIKRLAGLLTGLVLFSAFIFLPLAMPPHVARGLALALLCATWWVTEAVPPPVTALVPGVAMPLLGILPTREAFSSYAHPLIFLFLGGFIIARAMHVSGLDRRIATTTLSLAGTRPAVVLGAFMAITALLSAFISNTATTAMMLPIGLAVLKRTGLETGSRFGKSLLLGLAWAASIGGVATLVGTPPNAALAGFASRLLDREITFAAWLTVGVPFSAVMLPAAWVILLTRYRPEVKRIEINLAAREGTMESEDDRGTVMGRVVTTFVFLLVAWMWMTHGLLDHLPWDWSTRAGDVLTDSTIAIMGGIVLFALPSRTRPYEPVLTWRDGRELPWGVLLLFGGGLALGHGLFQSGAAQWIANHLSSAQGLPLALLVAAVCLLAMTVTEVTSNTATTNMLVPLLFVLAASMKVDPYILAIPATLACSSAFMLPVATPPNAIVYGSGYVQMRDMVLTGFLLNLVAAVIITLLTMLLVAPLWGL